MKINPPQRLEGKVWLRKFNEHLSDWISSSFTQSTYINQAIGALRNLYEREPHTAAFVANAISTLLLQHEDTIEDTDMEQICRRGLEALTLVSEESDLKQMTHWNISNYLAHALVELGKYDEALKLATTKYKIHDNEGIIQQFLLCKSKVVSALSYEALFNHNSALNDFNEAAELLRNILTNKNIFGDLLIALLEFQYPNPPKSEAIFRALMQIQWRNLSKLVISAVAGGCRCVVLANPSSINKQLEDLLTISQSNGLTDIKATEIAPIISLAETNYAIKVTEALISQVEKLGLDKVSYQAVLYAAISSHSHDAAVAEQYRVKADTAIKNVFDNLEKIAAIGLLMISDNKKEKAYYVDTFIDLILQLEQSNDKRIIKPAYRQVFDEPILYLVHLLAEKSKGKILWEEANRILLARLLDYNLAGSTGIDNWIPSERINSSENEIFELSRDYLGRIQYALNSWKDTLIIIIRTYKNRSLFLCLSSTDDTLAEFSDSNYGSHTRFLNDFLNNEIETYLLTLNTGSIDEVKKLGSKAYKAMPKSVQKQIEKNELILVCPDHRANGGSAPFELFYNGEQWLGIEKSVSRFPNIRSILRCIEGTNRRNESKRMLALAVPNVEEFLPPLKFATKEVKNLQKRFEKLSWDVPNIEEERILPNFIMDRLPYITHFHVASHGDIQGQQESLVLSMNERLSSSELASRFFPNMPSAFINSCELGSIRWAGSGIAQGIPYAFIDSGSSAVIANILPVEDQISTKMAISFYSKALKKNFGDSLRDVRKQLSKQEIHPIFWGSIILVGDPTTKLFDHNKQTSISQNLLDAFILGKDSKIREDAWEKAISNIVAFPNDSRTRASILLLRLLEDNSLFDENDISPKLINACRIAWEINHLPLLGLLLYQLHKKVDKFDSEAIIIKFYDNVLNILETLANDDPMWSNMNDQILVEWFQRKKGERKLQTKVNGPEELSNDNSLDAAKAIINMQIAAQAKEIRKSGESFNKRFEKNIEDILWNIIVASRDYQFEGMPEIINYSELNISKLINANAFPETSRNEAVISFAGLFHWLWRSQNIMHLTTDMIEGQTGVLYELIKSLSKSWQKKEWFQVLLNFKNESEQELNSLNKLPYDNKLTVAINNVMDKILYNANDTLEIIQSDWSVVICEATAWIMGCLIEINTYSYLDGSVPEELEKKLRNIQYDIDGKAEDFLYLWLEKGFKSVREKKLDELSRWKYNM